MRGPISNTRTRESGASSLSSDWADVWRGASPQDVIIFVIGPTAAGKSTFVRAVAPSGCRHNILPHHGLESDVKKFVPVIISDYSHLSPSSVRKLGGGRLIIVDTPGYDDTWSLPQDLQIMLGTCLRDMRSRGLDLGGIIYLYDIAQNRLPPRKFADHLEPYKDLLPTPYASIVLGLTGFTETQPEQIPRRMHLESEHWRDFITRGSHVMIFPRNSSTSHWKALDLIIKCFEDTNRAEAAEGRIFSLLNPKRETRRGRFMWFKRLFVFL